MVPLDASIRCYLEPVQKNGGGVNQGCGVTRNLVINAFKCAESRQRKEDTITSKPPPMNAHEKSAYFVVLEAIVLSNALPMQEQSVENINKRWKRTTRIHLPRWIDVCKLQFHSIALFLYKN